MNTLEQLQKHLATKPKEISFNYSTPREDYGPYTEVEVWRATAPVTEFDYSDDDPSAYVPIEQVVQFIDNHEGMV